MSGLRLAALALALAAAVLPAGAGSAQVRRRPPRTGPARAAREAAPKAVVTPKATVVPKTSAAPQAAATPQAAPTPQADPAPQAAPRADLKKGVPPKRVGPAASATVDFGRLAAQQAKAARLAQKAGPAALRTVHRPQTIREVAPRGDALKPAAAPQTAEPYAFEQSDAAAPSAPSPLPSQGFLAQEDGPKAGGGGFVIPPDTVGAVGLDKVFTQTNTNYRVHSKATGAALSTVSMDSFWAATGASGVFDPKVVYDPYNNRWILAAASDADSTAASLLVGLSDTADPQGTYHLYRFTVEGLTGSNTNWADFPMLGFNKNWVVVTANLFSNGFPFFDSGLMLVLDYPALRANTVNAMTPEETITADESGFCVYPATTLSPDEPNLYMVSHFDSPSAAYRVFYLAGEHDAPTLAASDFKARAVNGQGGWTRPDGDLLPQTCDPAGLPCPAAVRYIDSGDSFVRSGVVFRGGRIYYAQTVGIGAAPGETLTHTAAQWTVLDAATFDAVDGGRVEDPSATNSNGGRWYAYPSLAVNKNGAVMLGFSEFESDDFADAGYSLRLASDPPGTMREPVIYKEGEDYYEKTFGSGSNRWGDYSHTVVDPSNDRDLWTVQEYAGTRVPSITNPTDGDPTKPGNSNICRWGTWWAKVTAPAGAGELLISEFRLFGPNGPAGGAEPNNDEFIELYNNTDAPLTVAAADGSAGYSVAASDGVVRCTVVNGHVIRARGHFLCVNLAGYSLSAYRSGGGLNAAGDASYNNNIPANAGIALFNTANPANFGAATRLDAVGSSAEANALYREGAGYAPLAQSNVEQSLYRDPCGKGGSMTQLGDCPGSGRPKDTGDNAADFIYVDTAGAGAGAGARLGAPGPENLSSPVERTSLFSAANVDPAVGSSAPPNRVRNLTPDPVNNAQFGTLSIRKTVTNSTGAAVTRLRFRVVDITTYPAPAGFADLRPRTSAPVAVQITGPNAACPSNVCAVQGTTLEQPPAQPAGGGFNSSLSAGTVTLASPLASGASVNVQFLFGVQATGTFKFYIVIEALP